MGLEFTSNLTFFKVGTTVTFTTKWESGTDVNFTITYEEGAFSEWNWLKAGHTQSYLTNIVQHQRAFNACGVYDVLLHAWNEAGHNYSTQVVSVDPDLQTALHVDVIYTPGPTPTSVNISMQVVGQSCDVMALCNISYGDGNISQTTVRTYGGHFSFIYVYTVELIHVLLSMSCYNSFSVIAFSKWIILQENISNVDVLPYTYYINSAIPADFNISVLNGSHVEFIMDFQDGTGDIMFTHPSKYSSNVPMKISHHYMNSGTFQIQVLAKNFYSNSTYTSSYSVVVQHPVTNLTLIAPDLLAYPPSELTVTIDPAKMSRAPTNPECTCYVDDKFMNAVGASNLELLLQQDVSFQLTRSMCGKNLTVNITCFNLVSVQYLYHNMQLEESITHVSASPNESSILTHSYATFQTSVQNGSNVMYEVEFQPGNKVTQPNSAVVANGSQVTWYHMYETAGNYTVNITASNEVSSNTTFVIFIVQERVVNLTVSGNIPTVWPDGNALFLLRSDSGYAMQNVHCHWNMDDTDLVYQYLPSVHPGLYYEFQYNFRRSSIGVAKNTVNCSNLVSWYLLNFTTEVILDTIIIDLLTSNGSVLYTNTSVFTLTLQRFGTGSCIAWDMGDGTTPLFYGRPNCQSYAIANSMVLIPIEHGIMEYVQEYIYSNFGVFNVKVFAFNQWGNDSSTVQGVVLDWNCFKPNISVPANVSDPTVPLVMWKSTTFSIYLKLDIDCMKTSYVNHLWEIYDSRHLLSSTQSHANVLQYVPRMLSYGTYTAIYTASMVNVTNTTNTVETYLKIIPTPYLNASISNMSRVTVEYNAPVEFNAMEFSYDPDVDASDKSGMSFKWTCRHQNESITDAGTNICLEDETPVAVDDYTGCFGHGPCTFTLTDGRLHFSTGKLLPDETYVVQVTVSKDVRIGHSQQVVYVLPTDPPEITVR